jgi:hypothetical protein
MSKVEGLRPVFKHRTSSCLVPKLEAAEGVNLASTTPSKEISEASSNNEDTANNSASLLEDESPQLELTSQDGSASPPKPNMLLVEVRFILPCWKTIC